MQREDEERLAAHYDDTPHAVKHMCLPKTLDAVH